MGAIFKSIGKGLLNIILIPAFLVGLVFSAIAGIGVFAWELIKQLGRFFTGKPLSTDLPEDVKAKEMIAAAQKQREEQITGKSSDVEIVQAEIADPIASYRDFAREAAQARAIESKEDVDFMLDDVPFEIDISVDKRHQYNREIPQQPEKAPVENNNNSDNTAIERYEPKGSKF